MYKVDDLERVYLNRTLESQEELRALSEPRIPAPSLRLLQVIPPQGGLKEYFPADTQLILTEGNHPCLGFETI